MAKQNSEHNDKEVQAIREHMKQQDERFSKMEKKFDEVLILLSGSLIGKTKGLVEVVDEISTSLEDMITKFAHAEDWRVKFKAAQVDHEARNEKRKQLAEQREYEAQQKDKEIEALKRSSKIKNWIAAAAVAASIAKYIFDHLSK